jgi:hypothetical protein
MSCKYRVFAITTLTLRYPRKEARNDAERAAGGAAVVPSPRRLTTVLGIALARAATRMRVSPGDHQPDAGLITRAHTSGSLSTIKTKGDQHE